ncbi:TlyA family RNA methyltransferase [Bacillus pseudomycoides]|uniref:TlyA family RNA methyltransferase n=1 Tax=Bacillus pseudomycoides TaxID=64104 RepID=UPI000BF0B93C|nr:TlyA family RNA methyltransferase [Bacillus pseudomycoides]PEJ37265.1 TlyA family rRNA (cytidine-2'-O)-methyltransferase [Bacillus pseudomycoides]PHA98369.1 TlyA family rRNA (cytidine-2'-O)-methyltransferase [Bacillus pseudomycoides]PHC78271.1 TlyA family rRNA (cytidine-2'-O)-methyltransferase [Bacillus pseudomycoides]
MSVKKERVDVLLVERGLIETREKAKRAVMAGLVYANEMRLDKPGEKIPQDTPITVKGQVMPYVSRGGYKLEKALETFHLDLQDKIMLDIGSSTGGFTDCALQNGAKLSYALDVGYNQLAWKLRQDERVVVMERTNFRYVTPTDLERGLPQFASIDVSFISLKLILPVLKTILTPNGDVAALIKPQFEAGREQVGKKGIVRDRKVHEAVVEMIVDFAIKEGYDVENLTFSPITGGDGNIEFLVHLKWRGEREIGEKHSLVSVEQVVTEAHEVLKQKGKEE